MVTLPHPSPTLLSIRLSMCYNVGCRNHRLKPFLGCTAASPIQPQLCKGANVVNANFLWTTITVKSIETSLSFYKDLLGLTVERRFMPHPALELCFLKDENGIEVELLEHKPATDSVTAPANLSLGFQRCGSRRRHSRMQRERYRYNQRPV
jgi:hypothetical protein